MKKKIEYLTQREHAARLGIRPETVWRAQKSNTFKTQVFNRRKLYVWIDGEPQYNKKED